MINKVETSAMYIRVSLLAFNLMNNEIEVGHLPSIFYVILDELY